MIVFKPRKIFYYRNYFKTFYESLKPDTKKKVNWTIELICNLQRVPAKYFNHLTDSDGLYEIRIEFNSEIYRVFSFFDEDNLIVLGNGFQKKTAKTPKAEIQLA
ncbi:MAG: type II toxin-antitoxin system RelE/ParE family toxin, partial [Bacteroidota bacterium]